MNVSIIACYYWDDKKKVSSSRVPFLMNAAYHTKESEAENPLRSLYE